MIQLDFKGQYDLDSFLNIVKKEDVNAPGVYIWGFQGLIPDKPDTVVPYYVGEDTYSILRRINDHICDIDSKCSTYSRFTENYFKEFYKCTPANNYPKYPLKKPIKKPGTSPWKDWTAPNVYKNCFEYYNDEKLIYELNHNGSKNLIETSKGFPIGNIKDLYNTPKDTLMARINKNNFWIWYAKIDIDKESPEYLKYGKFKSFAEKLMNKSLTDRNVFEIFEAFVKFSLKGITIGKHEGSFKDLANYSPYIEIKDCNNIFKDKPSELFLGSY